MVFSDKYRTKSLLKMSRLRTEVVSSQMPDSVSIGFKFRFREFGYRFV
jgi:hypothetical protein